MCGSFKYISAVFKNSDELTSTMPFERITVVNVRTPEKADINTELQWLGAVLGLFGERDRDSSCFRVFVQLVQATHKQNPLTSDDIAHHTNLTRGTVVHHLNKLRDCGLVKNNDEGYQLAAKSVTEMLDNVEQEMQRLLELSKAVAKDIDRQLGT
jgi:predicted transcriptional regulator